MRPGRGARGGGSDLYVGDAADGTSMRALIRFELPVGDPIERTILQISLNASQKNQPPASEIYDLQWPLANPGLGELRAVAIADYDDPGPEDYAAPALGPAIPLLAALAAFALQRDQRTAGSTGAKIGTMSGPCRSV